MCEPYEKDEQKHNIVIVAAVIMRFSNPVLQVQPLHSFIFLQEANDQVHYRPKKAHAVLFMTASHLSESHGAELLTLHIVVGKSKTGW
jgi:hypothetical protein